MLITFGLSHNNLRDEPQGASASSVGSTAIVHPKGKIVGYILYPEDKIPKIGAFVWLHWTTLVMKDKKPCVVTVISAESDFGPFIGLVA